MAKRKSSARFSLPSFTKKSTITTIVGLLTWVIYQLVEHATPTQPTKLPASDQPLLMYANQTGDDLTSLYVNAIQSAKESITFVIYALTDAQVTNALNKQSEAGIPVYIVCDGKASVGIGRRIPKATIVNRLSQGLMHQKILIVDNKWIWLGSANMTHDSLRVHGNLVFGLENPALAQALTIKAKGMDETGKSNPPMLHRETTVGSQNLELWILPDDPNAVARMIKLFRSAQKTIRVAMFTWTRVDFTEELIQAAKRGVKVEAVVDRYSGKGASAKIVRMLDEAGISVRLSTGQGLLHHKFVYIDDTTLVNGSANWTNSAFKVNDDCFIVLYPLTAEQQDKMSKLWSVLQKNSSKPGESAAAPAEEFKGFKKKSKPFIFKD